MGYRGKSARRTLCGLGRLDRPDPRKVDGVVPGLRRYAYAQAAPGVRPAEAPILATQLPGPLQR